MRTGPDAAIENHSQSRWRPTEVRLIGPASDVEPFKQHRNRLSMHRYQILTQLTRGLIACALLAPSIVHVSHAQDALDLSAYQGQVVLVDFWASWCSPCRRSFPWLNEMSSKYGGRGLVVIGVNVDRERTEAERFLRDIPASFPILYDSEGLIATRYDVPGMPTSFVIGPDGEIVARHVGFRDSSRAEREAELQRLLSSVDPEPRR